MICLEKRAHRFGEESGGDSSRDVVQNAEQKKHKDEGVLSHVRSIIYWKLPLCVKLPIQIHLVNFLH